MVEIVPAHRHGEANHLTDTRKEFLRAATPSPRSNNQVSPILAWNACLLHSPQDRRPRHRRFQHADAVTRIADWPAVDTPPSERAGDTVDARPYVSVRQDARADPRADGNEYRGSYTLRGPEPALAEQRGHSIILNRNSQIGQLRQVRCERHPPPTRKVRSPDRSISPHGARDRHPDPFEYGIRWNFCARLANNIAQLDQDCLSAFAPQGNGPRSNYIPTPADQTRKDLGSAQVHAEDKSPFRARSPYHPEFTLMRGIDCRNAFAGDRRS